MEKLFTFLKELKKITSLKRKPKQSQITDHKLKQLIVFCISARQQYEEIKTEDLTQVEFTSDHCTVEEFLKHETALIDFESKKRDYVKACKNRRQHLVDMEKLLWSIIPAYNIWFITQDGEYAAMIKKVSSKSFILGSEYELMYTSNPGQIQIFGKIYPPSRIYLSDLLP